MRRFAYELRARLRPRFPPMGGRRKTALVHREARRTDGGGGRERAPAPLRAGARPRNREWNLGNQARRARLAGNWHRHRRESQLARTSNWFLTPARFMA